MYIHIYMLIYINMNKFLFRYIHMYTFYKHIYTFIYIIYVCKYFYMMVYTNTNKLKSLSSSSTSY